MEQATVKFARGYSSEPDFERFNTCKHRSETEETYTLRTCCQSKQETGWICRKIPIYGLSPNHCKDCPVYSPKEVVQQENQS